MFDTIVVRNRDNPDVIIKKGDRKELHMIREALTQLDVWGEFDIPDTGYAAVQCHNAVKHMDIVIKTERSTTEFCRRTVTRIK